MIRKALKLKPDYYDGYNDLGIIYLEQTKLKDAEFNFRKVITLKPDYAEAHNNLGNVFKEQGFISSAIDSYRTAIEISSDYTDAHSNLLLCLNYFLDRQDEIYQESLKWNQQYGG